mmetsp:Transcript_20499/g.33083  ORF Transcript_20499/g.33083 Transcript_20499/m.33083 type:complete len:95 (-) Transcript_20499:178-462(-)
MVFFKKRRLQIRRIIVMNLISIVIFTVITLFCKKFFGLNYFLLFLGSWVIEIPKLCRGIKCIRKNPSITITTATVVESKELTSIKLIRMLFRKH